MIHDTNPKHPFVAVQPSMGIHICTEMPIEIILDQKSSIFRPGDVVSGFVTILFNNESNTSEIELECSGKVTIAGRDGLNGSQTLFRTVQTLTAEGDPSLIEVPSFSFRQRLPTLLPPSYAAIDNEVSVQYRVEARMKRPWENGDVTVSTEKILYIVTVQELYPRHLERVASQHKIQSVLFCCCIPTMDITFNLSKNGFVAGEDIEVEAIVNNKSSYEFFGQSIQLIQIVSVVAEPGYAYHRNIIYNVSLNEVVIPQQTNGYIIPQRTITIPAVPPTCVKGNDVVSIKYEIQCSFKTPSLYRDLVAIIPITIATYPHDVSEVFRSMKLLPPHGSKIRRRPSSDLDSDEFSKTLEIVSPQRSVDVLHATTSNHEDGHSFCSDSDQMGEVNVAFQNYEGIDPAKKRKDLPRCLYYKREADGWTFYHVRNRSNYESNISPQFYNNL